MRFISLLLTKTQGQRAYYYIIINIIACQQVHWSKKTDNLQKSDIIKNILAEFSNFVKPQHAKEKIGILEDDQKVQKPIPTTRRVEKLINHNIIIACGSEASPEKPIQKPKSNYIFKTSEMPPKPWIINIP